MTQDNGRLLKKAANQLNRNFDQFAQQYGLTSMQMAIIDFIGRHEGRVVTQRDIEHEFNIQRSTATTMLQRMEKKQLIVRQVLKDDARQKQVQLLPDAIKLENVVSQYMLKENERLSMKFTYDDIMTFQRILTFYANDHKNQDWEKSVLVFWCALLHMILHKLVNPFVGL